MAEQNPDERQSSRRQFLKGVAGAASALTLATVLGSDSLAADPPAPAAAETPPVAPPTYGPDFSICHTAEERALLERQYAGALETVQVIRKAKLPPGVEPVTTFAALPRMISATAPPPTPAPQTPPIKVDR